MNVTCFKMIACTLVFSIGIFFTTAREVFKSEINVVNDDSIEDDEPPKTQSSYQTTQLVFHKRNVSDILNVDGNHIKGRNKHNQKQIRHFTDFLLRLTKTLKEYDDDDLKEVIAIFNEEIRKFHYRGCKFHELLDNLELRRFLGMELDAVQDKPAHVVRRYLKSIHRQIKQRAYSAKLSKLVNMINSIYTNESIKKMEKFLKNIDTYRVKTRKNADLRPIVKEGIRDIIFDHYTQLEPRHRAEFRSALNEFWNDLKTLVVILENYLAVSADSIGTHRQTSSAELNQESQKKTKEERDDDSTNDSVYSDASEARLSTKRSKPKPTTNRSIIEFKDGERELSTRKEEKRLDKFNNIFDHSSESLDNTQTTNGERTYRQMYVEKNLDLKYNPYAYDHLTTKVKSKIYKRLEKTRPKMRMAETLDVNTTNTTSAKEMQILWYETNRLLDDHKARHSAIPKFVADEHFKEDVEASIFRHYAPWRIVRTEIFKNGEPPQLHLKKPEFQLKVPSFL